MTATAAATTASGECQQLAAAASSPPQPAGASSCLEVDGGGFVPAKPFAAQSTADLSGALARDGGGAGGGCTSGGGSGGIPTVTLTGGGGGDGGGQGGAAATSSIAPPRRAMTAEGAVTRTGDRHVARKTSAPALVGLAGWLAGTLRRAVGHRSVLGGPGCAGGREGGAAAAGADEEGSRADSSRGGGPCRGQSKALRRTAVLRRCSGLGEWWAGGGTLAHVVVLS